MFEKIKQKFDRINETYFNIGYIVLTILATVLATVFGFAAAEVVAGILIKATIFSTSSIIFLKAFMGADINVKQEILEQNNSALAILVAGFLIGLGMSIGGI